mgnify:FL=1
MIRYERGTPSCAKVFFWQNDRARSDRAIAMSDRAVVDPQVVDALRADLAEQYLKHAPRGGP